jgi:two-component system, CitB family, sensor kinase
LPRALRISGVLRILLTGRLCCVRRRSGRRLSSQILVYQLLILLATLLVGVALSLRAAQSRLDGEFEQRALGVASSVASSPEIAAAVAAHDRSGTVQTRAEAVRRRTHTAFVVVTDERGIRYSHPRPERIGEVVSTEPEALEGRTVLAVEKGTLGRSARAKVPLRDASGRIVGQVSVGVLESSIRRELSRVFPLIALYGGLALLAGMLASLGLARRLKRQTFGLELSDIANLVHEREAMLHGIREAVVGVDPEGRVRVVNDEARRLLALPADAVGRTARELAGESRLADLLDGRLAGDDLVLVHGERVLIANRMPVRRDDRDLGAVVTLRDRTELEALVRELGNVRDLTDAMRAQAHEFSNHIHTIAGLLELGHHDEAVSFVNDLAHADAGLRGAIAERVTDPMLAALLAAKAAVAAERGVELRVAPTTDVGGELADARPALTVLGNLIDNALDAARGAEEPWVEVGLELDEDSVLAIRVEDSGPGVPPELGEAVFEPDYSTKPERGVGARGVGLSLVRRLAERRGGEVSVREGRCGGALFEVRLPVRAAQRAGALP